MDEIDELAEIILQIIEKTKRTLGDYNNIALFYANMIFNLGYRKN